MRSLFDRVRSYSADIRLFFLYTLLANVAIGVAALVFNLYLIELGQQEDFIGIYNAVQTLAMAAGALMLGRLIDRYGIWWVVTAGLVAFLISTVLLSVITQPAAILVFSALVGTGSAMILTPVMPFIAELTSRPRDRHEVAALTMSLISLSTMLGSLVGGWVPPLAATIFGLEHPGASAFRISLLLGVAIAGLAVVPLMLMSPERKTSRPDDEPEPSGDQQTPTTPAVLQRRMLVYVAVGAVMAVGGGAVFPFYNVYLSSIGAGSGDIGLVFAGAWLVAAVVGLGAPRIAARLGSQLGSTVVRLAPIPLFLLLIPFSALPIAIMAHLIRVSSTSMSWSMESSFISSVLPGRMRNAAFGYRSAAWNVGYSLATIVAGGLIVRYGYDLTFAVYVATMVVAMSLYYWYFRGLADASFVEERAVVALRRKVPAPEHISEEEAPASLQLEPGRGRPVIISSHFEPELLREEAAVTAERTADAQSSSPEDDPD